MKMPHNRGLQSAWRLPRFSNLAIFVMIIVFLGAYRDIYLHKNIVRPIAGGRYVSPSGCLWRKGKSTPEINSSCEQDPYLINDPSRYGLTIDKNSSARWVRVGNDAALVLCGPRLPRCEIESYLRDKFYVPRPLATSTQ